MLIAFNNLYSGTTTLGAANGTCTATDGTTLLAAPTVLWAYNVATTVDGDGITSSSVSLFRRRINDNVRRKLAAGRLGAAHFEATRWRRRSGDELPHPSPFRPRLPTLNWAGCTACMWNIPFTEDPAGFDHPSAGGGPVLHLTAIPHPLWLRY